MTRKRKVTTRMAIVDVEKKPGRAISNTFFDCMMRWESGLEE